jgi:hypothetical protein
MSFAAGLFRLEWGRRLLHRWCGPSRRRWRGTSRRWWWRRAARGRTLWVRRPLRRRSVVRVATDHLRRLPTCPWVVTRGRRPVVVHINELTTASRDDPPPARSRRRRQCR